MRNIKKIVGIPFEELGNFQEVVKTMFFLAKSQRKNG